MDDRRPDRGDEGKGMLKTVNSVDGQGQSDESQDREKGGELTDEEITKALQSLSSNKRATRSRVK